MELQKPLRGPSLNDSVKEYVKSFILENHMHPGDPLPNENQLALELGVGRSSVREAIKALQMAGIVDVRHGKGLYVREYNLDSIIENLTFGICFNYTAFQEWLQIRIWLETKLIEDVVHRITDREIRHLEDILLKWQDSIDNGVHRPELDQEFHLALYRPLKNETLLRLFASFWEAFQSLEYRELSSLTLEESRSTLQDHWSILYALRDRNPAEVSKYLNHGFDLYYERTQQSKKSDAPDRPNLAA